MYMGYDEGRGEGSESERVMNVERELDRERDMTRGCVYE